MNKMNKVEKKQRRIIKNIKVCRQRLYQIYTEICSLDNDAHTFFSKVYHKNIWKLQENKLETDSEYDSDATVDLFVDLPNIPLVHSDSELSFNLSSEDEDEDEDNGGGVGVGVEKEKEKKILFKNE